MTFLGRIYFIPLLPDRGAHSFVQPPPITRRDDIPKFPRATLRTAYTIGIF